MRYRLVLAAVAATTTIVLAFCVPLARLVSDVARDRAIASAERDAERVTGALSVTLDADVLLTVIESTPSGDDGRLGIVLPGGAHVGAVSATAEEITLGQGSDAAFTVEADGAVLLVAPVELSDGIAVIDVRIPDDDLTRGVSAAWIILAGVAVVILVVGVLVADRLAVSVTRPAVALAEASRRVAEGDLAVRVEPDGPPELERVARGFNDLAGRLTDLVEAERRDVADLAHRLRTPVAAMRLDVDGIDDPEVCARLADDVTALERAVDTVIREARHPVQRAVSPMSDLAAVVRERITFWSALADEQGRPWTADVPTGVMAVGVPRAELVALVDALVDNVFTHTPPATAFEVTVAAVEHGRVRLVVRDHGPGVGLSLATAGSTTGHTGIGLDIATRAAAGAGGTIDLVDDGGAVVTVELPLLTPDAVVPPAVGRRHHLAATPPSQLPSSC